MCGSLLSSARCNLPFNNRSRKFCDKDRNFDDNTKIEFKVINREH
jgi:hypothetical protein